MRKQKLHISRRMVSSISKLSGNRDKIHGITTGFLQNVTPRILMVDYVFKTYKSSHKKSEDPVVLLSICQFISSLVSCWETYFRDVIDFVTREDKRIHARAISYIEQISNSTFQTTELESHGISLGDYYCKHFNLQNLDDLCNAFNHLFDKRAKNIFEYIRESLQYRTFFTEENYFMYWMYNNNNFNSTLYDIASEAFEMRHQFIHDANFKFLFDHKKIAQYEHLLVIFPQFISVWLANTYDQRRLVFDFDQKAIRYTDRPNDREGSYIISPKEIRAKDWRVVV